LSEIIGRVKGKHCYMYFKTHCNADQNTL